VRSKKEELRSGEYGITMQNNKRDLQQRTRRFALGVIRTFRDYLKVRKRRFSENNCCVRAHQSECADSLRELEETAYWLELLLEAGIVPPEKLGELRKECDELIAIFVTILKRSKEPFETS